MGDTLQYRRVKGLKYSLGKGEIILKMDGTKDFYYSNADEVQINPNSIELDNCRLEKEVVAMEFSKPITCNIKSGKYNSMFRCGTSYEGKEPFKYVERLEDLSDRLDFFRDESIKKRKDESQSMDLDE